MFITGIVIKLANEINNLGYLLDVEIVGNLIRRERKCYRTVESILSKCVNKPELVIPLCKAYCFPILLYGSEVLLLNNSH